MLAVRLAQVSACLRTLDGQAPAVYQALAASLAWKPAADPSASRSAYQSQKCCLSTGGLRAQTSKLPSGPSSGAWSCGTSQRSFAADATPSSSEADQINPLLQAPSPGTAGSLGRPSDTAQAILRGAAISPKKLNHFASVVRGLHVEDALIQCKASPLKAADMTHRLLQSAKANATNNHGLSADKLYVDLAFVGNGQHLKRTKIHGRGRSGSMHRYRAHLTVVLREGLVPRRVKIGRPLMERLQSRASNVAVRKTSGAFRSE